MAGRLEGKVALITGAAAGLGRVGAERFAREGACVVVADVADGSAVAEGINEAGGRATYVECDVTDGASVEGAVEAAVRTYGGLHVLYNNAGVMPSGDADPVATSEETFEQVMDVNVKGVWRCCKSGIPALLDSGGGSVVNVASFVALMGAATPQIAYTSSKGAVAAMTREIAVVYARRGVRANALCPGPVLTPMLAKFMESDAERERRLVHIPVGRFGEPAEIVNAALFLASDESSFVTGHCLVVDGGITAAYVTPE